MGTRYRALSVSVIASLMFLCTGGMADPLVINFDQIMHTVWTESGIWPVVQAYGVLPPSFSLEPNVCDINGGFDISVTPVVFFPNGMLDSDELALIAAILANPAFDCTASGGTSHEMVHNAWNGNFAQVYRDLGCCVGGPEVLLPPTSIIPDVEFLFCALMTLGDMDSQAFPIMLMDLTVNNEFVSSLIGDPNLHVPDPEQYQLMNRYLAWCGDADGDGCSNLHEYQYYYPIGGRSAFINAALDPGIKPPGCAGDRLCDGSGGLYGEYFDTRNMTDLKVIRIDPQVSFDWGQGQPHPSVGADTFSICWSGWVIPDYAEVYTFYVRTDDGVRLWVNNELLVDQWNDHGATTYSGVTSAPLVAGQEYPSGWTSMRTAETRWRGSAGRARASPRRASMR